MDKKIKQLNILGTEYTIFFDVSPDDMPDDADGCMDHSINAIKIVAMKPPDRNSLQNLDEYKKKVLRHEIIHAFLYESGLWGCTPLDGAWAESEEITDWIAIQSPKLFAAFKEVCCL